MKSLWPGFGFGYDLPKLGMTNHDAGQWVYLCYKKLVGDV